MTYEIENLYHDKKFNIALFYFKERDFIFVYDLLFFDFNELMFVPGMSNEIILEMKEIYQDYIKTKTASAEIYDNKPILPLSEATLTSNLTITCIPQKLTKFKPTPTDSFHIDINVVPAVSLNDVKRVISNLKATRDANVQIADIYNGVPRSAPFVNYCFNHGKRFIAQLSLEDFEEAVNIKGLGIASVQVLKEIYIEYITKKTPEISTSKIDSDKVIENISAENVFKNLKGGQDFIDHCHKIGIANILDLKDFSITAAQLNGISSSYINKILKNYLESTSFTDVVKETIEGLEQISEKNMTLSIKYLRLSGISQSEIQELIDNGFVKVSDLCNKVIPQNLYSIVNKSVQFLSKPFTSFFINKLDNLKEKYRYVLIHKCQGYTLQSIGDDIEVTRERARQIAEKSCRILMPSAEIVAEGLIAGYKIFFTFQDIQNLFEDPSVSECCKYVLTESNNYVYLDFANKFIKKPLFQKSIETTLDQIVSELIGDSANYYDNLEIIESELTKYGLDFLDFEDIMNYLAKTGYHFYGEFVTKGKQSYALVCYDAVLKYFSFDIKLDSDENNEDIKYLRKIINKHYNGLILPEGNRALTARLADIMIISGRGRYCPIEKVIYSSSLLKEIYEYIQENKQSSFYYSELFSQFQGRLLTETNISNPYFLHGMLKYAYPDDFKYERVLLTKKGTTRQDIDARICNFIKSNRCPVTKSIIKEAFPGINDFVIGFVVSRVPDLLQWDYNEYNHILNITFNSIDYDYLNLIIQKLLKKHNGYLSSNMIYNVVKIEFSKFISKNSIKNSSNLYYILQHYFSKDYRFKYPHILDYSFPVDNITTSNIAKAMVNEETIKYSSFAALANSLGWSSPALCCTFSELTRNYIRISDDEYVISDSFNFSNDLLKNTEKHIEKLIEPTGYFAISDIFNFDSFPVCIYEWNGFLLESIIEKYDIGFKIIKPQVNEHRYQKGIIVRKNTSHISFEDLVISVLIKDKINKLTEIELQKYLRNKGLINNLLPQELYESKRMIFKNEIFTVKE